MNGSRSCGTNTMRCQADLRKEKGIKFVAPWMELESIMLSEVRRKSTDTK